MTDLFYIEDLSNPGVPLPLVRGMVPWFSHDRKDAQFYTYTMNLSKGTTTYQVKEFAPLSYLDVP